MHRIAIGDPQGVRHQLFTELRIRKVDGESLWRSFYLQGRAAPFGARPPARKNARGCPGLTGCPYCRCLVEIWNCGHVDISSGAHDKRAGLRQRAGDHCLWRAGTTSTVGIFGL